MSVTARPAESAPRHVPLSARERDQTKEAETLEVQALQAERSGDDQECIRLLESAMRLRTNATTGLADQYARQPNNESVAERYHAAAKELYDATERLVVKCNTFGVQCFKGGDFETATNTLNYALELTMPDAYPLNEVEELRRSLRGVSLNNLGCMERLRGHFKDALSYMQQSMEVTGVESAVAYMNISAILVQLRLSEDAMNMSQRAIELLEGSHGQPNEDPSLLGVAHHNLAMALEPVDPDRCLYEYERAYQLSRHALGGENPTTQSIERNWVRYQQRHRPNHVIQPAFLVAKAKSVKPKSLSDALSSKHPPKPPSDDVSLLFPHPFTQSGATSSTTHWDDRQARAYTAAGVAPNVPATVPKSSQQLRDALPPTKPVGQSPTSSTSAKRKRPGPAAGSETRPHGANGHAGAGGSRSGNAAAAGGRGADDTAAVAGGRGSGVAGNAAAAGGRGADGSAAAVAGGKGNESMPPLHAHRKASAVGAENAAVGVEKAGRPSGRMSSSMSPTKSGAKKAAGGDKEGVAGVSGGGRRAGAGGRQLSTSAAENGAAAAAAGGSKGRRLSPLHKESEGAGGGKAKQGARHGSNGAVKNEEEEGPNARGVRSGKSSAKDGKDAKDGKSGTRSGGGRNLPALEVGEEGGAKKARKHRSGEDNDGSLSSAPSAKKDGDRRGTAASNAMSENANSKPGSRHMPMGTAQEITMFELAGSDLTQYMTDRLDMLVHDEEELERKFVKATLIQKNYRGHYARRLVAQERENRLRTESLRHIKRSIAARIIQLAVYRHLHIPSRLGERKGHLVATKSSYGTGSDDVSATKIQRIARGWLARRRYRRMRQYQEDCRRSASVLQRWVRRTLSQKRMAERRREKLLLQMTDQERERAGYAATKIQSVWRGHVQQRCVEKELARRRLQRVLRERQERFQAARCIQCSWRSCAARMEVQRRRTAKIARDELRKFYISQRNATVKMQSYGRMLMERKQYLPELTEARLRAAKNVKEDHSDYKYATVIQTAFRGYLARRELDRLKGRLRRGLRDERENFLASLVQRVGRGFVARRMVGVEIRRLDDEAKRYQDRLAELKRKDEEAREWRETMKAAAGKIACLEEAEDDNREQVELEELRWRQTYHTERDEAVSVQRRLEIRPDADVYVPPPCPPDVEEAEEISEELPGPCTEEEGDDGHQHETPYEEGVASGVAGGDGTTGTAGHDDIVQECDDGELEDGERAYRLVNKEEDRPYSRGSKPQTGQSSQYEEVVEEIECEEEMDSQMSYEIVVEELIEDEEEEIPEELPDGEKMEQTAPSSSVSGSGSGSSSSHTVRTSDGEYVTITVLTTEEVTTVITEDGQEAQQVTTTTKKIQKRKPKQKKAPITSKYLKKALDIAPAPSFEVDQVPPAPKPLRKGPRPPKAVPKANGEESDATAAGEESDAAAEGGELVPAMEEAEDEASFAVMMARARADRDQLLFEHYRALKQKEDLRDRMHEHRMVRIEAAESEESLRPLGFAHGFGATAKRWKKRPDEASLYETLYRHSPSNLERAKDQAALVLTSLARGFLARLYVKRIRGIRDEYTKLRSEKEGPQRAPIDTTKLQRFQAMYPKVAPPKREPVPTLRVTDGGTAAAKELLEIRDGLPADASAVEDSLRALVPTPPSMATISSTPPSSRDRSRPLTQEQLQQERAALQRLQRIIREAVPLSSDASSDGESRIVNIEEMLRKEREAITRLQKMQAELSPLQSSSSRVSSRHITREEVQQERELLLRLKDIDAELRQSCPSPTPSASEEELRHERGMILRLKELESQFCAAQLVAPEPTEEELRQERALLTRLMEIHKELGGSPSESASRPSTQEELQMEKESIQKLRAEMPLDSSLELAEAPVRNSSVRPLLESGDAPMPRTTSDIPGLEQTMPQHRESPKEDFAAFVITQFMRMAVAKKLVQRLWNVVQDYIDAQVETEKNNTLEEEEEEEDGDGAFADPPSREECDDGTYDENVSAIPADASVEPVTKKNSAPLDLEGVGCITPACSPVGGVGQVFVSRESAQTEDRAADTITSFLRAVVAKRTVQRLWNDVQDAIDERVKAEKIEVAEEEKEHRQADPHSVFADPPSRVECDDGTYDDQEKFVDLAKASTDPFGQPESPDVEDFPYSSSDAIVEEVVEGAESSQSEASTFPEQKVATEEDAEEETPESHPEVSPMDSEGAGCITPTCSPVGGVGQVFVPRESAQTEDRAAMGITNFFRVVHAKRTVQRLWNDVQDAIDERVEAEKRATSEDEEEDSGFGAFAENPTRSFEEAIDDENGSAIPADAAVEPVIKKNSAPLDFEGVGCITPACSPVGGVGQVFVPRESAQTEDRAAMMITNFFRMVAAKKEVQRKWNAAQDRIDVVIDEDKLTPEDQKYITNPPPNQAPEEDLFGGAADPFAAEEDVVFINEKTEVSPMDSEGVGCVTPACSPVGGVGQVFVPRESAQTEDRAAMSITNFFRVVHAKRTVQRKWYDVQDAIDARVDWEKKTEVIEEEEPFAAADPFATETSSSKNANEAPAVEPVTKKNSAPLDLEGVGCITPTCSPVGGVGQVFVPRESAQTEDRAARKVTHFMRMVVAKRIMQHVWSLVQDYIDAKVEDERMASPVEEEDGTNPFATGDPFASTATSSDLAAEEETPESHPEVSPMDSEGVGCITPTCSPVGGVGQVFVPRESAQTEDRAADTITSFLRAVVAKRTVQRLWYDVQDAIDERVKAEKIEVAEDEPRVEQPANSEGRSSEEAESASTTPPSREGRCGRRHMERIAAKRIKAFLRQVVARRQLADLKLAKLQRLAANVRAENTDEDEAAERIQGLFHVYAARRLLLALRTSRNTYLESLQESDAVVDPERLGVPPAVGMDNRSVSSTSSCVNSNIDPGRSTAPPDENEERGLSRGSGAERKAHRLG